MDGRINKNLVELIILVLNMALNFPLVFQVSNRMEFKHGDFPNSPTKFQHVRTKAIRRIRSALRRAVLCWGFNVMHFKAWQAQMVSASLWRLSSPVCTGWSHPKVRGQPSPTKRRDRHWKWSAWEWCRPRRGIHHKNAIISESKRLLRVVWRKADWQTHRGILLLIFHKIFINLPTKNESENKFLGARYATIEGLLYWKMLLSVDSVHMCGNMRQEGAVTDKNTKRRRQKERGGGEEKTWREWEGRGRVRWQRKGD